MKSETTLKNLSHYRQQKREAMIRNILDAARQIMREQGVAALSMQELARRMGMRAPSLYNYFSTKMDIYDAIFRLGFILYQEQLNLAWQQAKTWQDTLRIALETYLNFAIQNPELYQLCFERPVPGFVPSEESLHVSYSSLQAAYARVAEIKSSLHTDLSVEQITNIVIAVIHGITAQHMANEPDLPPGEGRFGSLIPPVVSIFEKAWL